MVKRNVLLITCSFGEFSDSHTIRLRNMLAALGGEECNITCLVPCEMSQVSSLVFGGNFKVIGAGVPFLLRLEKFIGALRLTKLAWLFKNLSYRFSFPDQFMGWNIQAMKVLRKTDLREFDLILSASGSPEAHILAGRLKKNKPELFWIADFGDPWAEVDKLMRPWYFHYTKWVESRLLMNVDRCIFTTHSTERFYLNNFDITKSAVIPYGFNKSDLLDVSHRVKNDGLWTIGHIGTAHRHDRDLIPSIQAFDALSKGHDYKSRFILCGRHSVEFDSALIKSHTVDHIIKQSVPLEEAISLMYELDIQLLIGNKKGSQLPGKVFMAAAIPSPILYISQCDRNDDEAFILLKDLQGIVFVTNNSQSIREGLDTIINEWSYYIEESVARVNSRLLMSYESKSLANELIKLMD